VHKTVNHRQNFVNPVNGDNTQTIESALRCARLKIIKNADNVHPTSLPEYLAELWWRSMHRTTPRLTTLQLKVEKLRNSIPYECDVVKDTGKEEYLRPFIHIGLDWMH